jgi:hypothetical protein
MTAFYCCSNDDEPNKIFEEEVITINKETQEIDIKTNSDFWITHIVEIIDGWGIKHEYATGEGAKPPKEIVGDWYFIEDKGNSLYVKINENLSESDRELKIYVQKADIYDALIIKQKK